MSPSVQVGDCYYNSALPTEQVSVIAVGVDTLGETLVNIAPISQWGEPHPVELSLDVFLRGYTLVSKMRREDESMPVCRASSDQMLREQGLHAACNLIPEEIEPGQVYELLKDAHVIAHWLKTGTLPCADDDEPPRS